jgi:hypothetical protein
MIEQQCSHIWIWRPGWISSVCEKCGMSESDRAEQAEAQLAEVKVEYAEALADGEMMRGEARMLSDKCMQFTDQSETLRKRVAELEGLFSHVGVETHKWLDPECGHEGCQSLVLKARAEEAEAQLNQACGREHDAKERCAELEKQCAELSGELEAAGIERKEAEAQLASKTAAFALATVHAKELEAALKHETDCVEAAKAQLASLRPSVAEIERDEAIARAELAEAERDVMQEALEPFAYYADVKGGTLSGNTLQALIGEMMERLPYPEHLEAINLFCKACQEARAALAPSPATTEE